MTGGASGDEVTMEVTVFMRNYAALKLSVIVTLADKEVKRYTASQESCVYECTLPDPIFNPPFGNKEHEDQLCGEHRLTGAI